MNTELIESIKVIEAADGPKFPIWCHLDSKCIAEIDQTYLNMGGEIKESIFSDWFSSPPACECAVIAYAAKVCMWEYQIMHKRNSNVALRGAPYDFTDATDIIYLVAKELGHKK